MEVQSVGPSCGLGVFLDDVGESWTGRVYHDRKFACDERTAPVLYP